MNGIIARVQCYIKGDESNIGNKDIDVKEHYLVVFNSLQPKCMSHYTSHVKDKVTFKQSVRPTNKFMHLNTCWEKIWHEVLSNWSH